MATSGPGCVTVVVGGVADLLLLLGALAIPATAFPLIMRAARRRPSRALLTAGRGARGVTFARCGVAVLLGISNPESVQVLVVLAFTIHGCCTSVAARWSFTAMDLDPIGRAKAGEAGRTLGGVWVFLATYSVLAWLREDNDVFNSGAGSAVVGALTVGALAVTMGSGYTKYAEAIHGPHALPPLPEKGNGAAARAAEDVQ